MQGSGEIIFMENEIIGVLGLLLMFLLMALRVPIVISLIVPGILGALYIVGLNPLLTSLQTITWTHSFSYTFSTIPMFILMGELLLISKISSDMFTTFRKWLGNMKGGLATATVGASTLFAAAAGSSIASTGIIGVMAHKEMNDAGYDNRFSSGVIVAGGALGILIPPSTAFIIYGILTEQSIGKLLIAGIVPGVLLSVLYIITVYLIAHFKPSLAPPIQESYTFKERIISLKSTIWIVLLFTLVIGGMYAGLFSPTESGGIGAAGAGLIAILKRKLTFKTFIEAVERTLRTTGFIFAIILGAFIFNYFIATARLPMFLANTLTNLSDNPHIVMILIVLMYIVLGAVMDTLAMVVITIPIVLPIIEQLGYDPIWFGVWLVVLVELALITPPLGMNCFVLKGVAPDLKLEDIFKGAAMFFAPILVLLVLLYVFPDIVLWLPDRM